jgi:hypothetical protein
MSTHLRERIAQEIEDLSEDQQERLLQWIQIVRRGQVKPPTGELGLKRPFKRQEFYEDALPHRL